MEDVTYCVGIIHRLLQSTDKILLEYLINYNIVYSCYVLMRQTLRNSVLYYYFHSLQSTYRTIINETIKLRK